MKGRREASLHAGVFLLSGLLHSFLFASFFLISTPARRVSLRSFQVSLVGPLPSSLRPISDFPSAIFPPSAPSMDQGAQASPASPKGSSAQPGPASIPQPEAPPPAPRTSFRQWWDGVGIVNVPSARRAPREKRAKGPVTGGLAEWWKQQRSSPNPPTIARESAKQGAERTPPAQSSSIGRATIASATGIPPTYLSLIERKVSEQWELPAVPLSNELASVVLFVVTPAGEVMSPIVEESSGNPFFDQSALRAVVGTRLPPFPAGVEPHPLKVHFRFSIVRPS